MAFCKSCNHIMEWDEEDKKWRHKSIDHNSNCKCREIQVNLDRKEHDK